MTSILIVVANYNGEQLLPTCLPSLRAQTCPRTDIVVVDNCSNDNSIDVAKAHGVRVLEMRRNDGLGAAYNAGALGSRDDYIFFMNNDMRLEPHCIESLVQVLEDHSDAIAADPLQWSWDGDRLLHARTLIHPGRWFGEILPGFHLTFTAHAAQPVPICWGCAGCLLVRRSMLERLGGFDPTFFLNFEDVDLCWRGWRLGWMTWYVPRAQLWHRHGASQNAAVKLQTNPTQRAQNALPMRVKRSGERNRLRFVLKVMDPLYAIRYVINLVVRFGGHVVGGHTVEAWIIAWAWMSCLREVPVIWRERRHLTTQSRLSNRSLYKLWSDSGCLVQRTSEASDVVHYA